MPVGVNFESSSWKGRRTAQQWDLQNEKAKTLGILVEKGWLAAEPLDGDSIVYPSRQDVFRGVNITVPGTENPVKQYLLARTIGKPKAAAYENNEGEIPLVTGLCLFSKCMASAITEDDETESLVLSSSPITKRVSHIEVNKNPSLYELVSVAQLASLILDIADNNKVSVHFSIPRVEYYFYILDAVKDGYMSKEQASEWFKCVDERHATVESMLVNTICKVNSEVNFVHWDPLAKLGDYIANSVEECKQPDIDEALDILADGDNDSIWRSAAVKETIMAGKSPWIALADVSWTIPYMEIGTGDKLGLAVETYDEQRLLTDAASLSKKILAEMNVEKKLKMAAIYSHPSVATITDDGGNNLKYNPRLYRSDVDVTDPSEIREVINKLSVLYGVEVVLDGPSQSETVLKDPSAYQALLRKGED